MPVVPLRALPESIRGIVKEVGTDVRVVLEERKVAACRIIEEYTEAQRRLIDTWQWIAAGVHRACKVKLATGKPSCHH